jgi:hypothetical protein
MRIGMSDTKNVTVAPDARRHRVILPVYVPRLTGYFKDSLEILSLCLDSLRATSRGRVTVTLIANQCAPEVLEHLARYFREGWIDQVVVNHENRGRIDGVVSIARGSHEPLLTFADADVMFDRGWLDAVESLFFAFPECGMASVVPHPGTAWHHTTATVIGGLANRELGFDKVVSDEDIDRFGRSIGVPQWIKPEQRAQQLIVRRDGLTACVGCPHFLFTVRKEVMDYIPREPCLRPLGAGSDEIWYDRPPDVGGFWRLATPKAYAHHLGNVPEPWMHERLAAVQQDEPALLPAHARPYRRPLLSRIPWRARQVLAGAIRRRPVRTLLQDKTRFVAVQDL